VIVYREVVASIPSGRRRELRAPPSSGPSTRLLARESLLTGNRDRDRSYFQDPIVNHAA